MISDFVYFFVFFNIETKLIFVVKSAVFSGFCRHLLEIVFRCRVARVNFYKLDRPVSL